MRSALEPGRFAADPALAEVADWLAAAAATPPVPPPDAVRHGWPSRAVAVLTLGGGPAPVDFGDVDPLAAVEFSLDPAEGRRIELLGEWTRWCPVLLAREAERARVAFSLADGEHAYAFRADGRQFPDPGRPDAVGVGPQGPFSVMSLCRFERRLMVRNPGPRSAVVEADTLPPWLAVHPPVLELARKAKGELRLRIHPPRIPTRVDEDVQVGVARGPGGEAVPLLVRLRLARVPSSVAFIPGGLDARVEGRKVSLAVHGQALGTGLLTLRLRALPGLAEVGQVQVGLDERVGATVRFPSFTLSAPAGAESAELALDTGSPVWNLRFFHLTIPL